MQGIHSRFVCRQRRPAFAAVCTFIDTGAVCHGCTHVHICRSRVKCHPENADAVALLLIVALYRERSDLFPVLAVVRGFPQTTVTAAEPDLLVVVGIDAHPLAAATSGLVAAAAERRIKACPGLAVVVRGKQRRIVTHISTAGKIHPVRFYRVGRHAFDADIAPLVCAQKIGERHPVGVLFPAVQSADIGTGIDQTLFLGVILHAGDITAAADGNIAPGISLGAARSTAGADAAEHGAAQQYCRKPSSLFHVCVLRIPLQGDCKNFLLSIITENGGLVNISFQFLRCKLKNDYYLN